MNEVGLLAFQMSEIAIVVKTILAASIFILSAGIVYRLIRGKKNEDST